MISFDAPQLLWGGLAALIPLAIHLVQRRRARVHPFAAMAFLLGNRRRVARRYRLRELLLLTLRMLLLAALAVAFAKPWINSAEPALVGNVAPSSVVIVIDPSASMTELVEGRTLLARAIERARGLVSDLRSDSDAAVVVAQSPARALTSRLTFDRKLVSDVLTGIRPTQGRADLAGALRLAEQILVESAHERREVVLFTDLQATEWEGLARPWALDRTPSVKLVDVTDGATRRNGAVTRVVAEPITEGAQRELHVSVDVLNDRPESVEDVITVRVGTKTAKSVVRIEPRATLTQVFTIALPEGDTFVGSAEIGHDARVVDDSRPFVVDLGRRIDVLVVDGAPRSVPHEDEVFFLRAALRPGRDAAVRAHPTVIRADELTAEQVAGARAVILANVQELDAEQAVALERWVRDGNGLMVTAGDNFTETAWNGLLAPLLVLPMRGIETREDEPVYIAGLDVEHPVLRPFAALPDASIYTAKTRRYLQLATHAAPDTHVLASFSDGAPALLTRQLGKGRLLLLTTSIDRDWTDLPFKSSFLPLIQQAVVWLSGREEAALPSEATVASVVAVPVVLGATALSVEGPSGRRTTFASTDLLATDVRFRDTHEAGVYTVHQVAGSQLFDARFAVGVDPRESRVSSIQETQALALLDTRVRQPVGASAADTPQAVAVRKPPERKRDVWPFLLASLFVLLALETWLAVSANRSVDAI